MKGRQRTTFLILLSAVLFLDLMTDPNLAITTREVVVVTPIRMTPTRRVQRLVSHGDEQDDCSLEAFMAYREEHGVKPTPLSLDCLEMLWQQDQNNVYLLVELIKALYLSRSAGSDRHVAYVCPRNTKRGCGGLGDRLRGMTNSFFLAIWMGATFSPHMDAPIGWHHYLQTQHAPLRQTTTFWGDNDNAIDWGILLQRNETEHYVWDSHIMYERNKTRGKTLNMRYFAETDFPNTLFRNNKRLLVSERTFRWDPVLDSNPCARNLPPYLHRVLRDRGLRTHVFYRLWMHDPTPYTQRAIQTIPLGRTMIGVHVRVGGMTMETHGWRDPPRHDHPNTLRCFLQHAQHMCPGDDACTIYLASDSPEIINLVEDNNKTDLSIVTFRGHPLTHMDKTKHNDSNVLSENLRSWVDWLVLARHCQGYVLSRSGYGETASWYQANRYGFLPAHRIADPARCQFTDFRQATIFDHGG